MVMAYKYLKYTEKEFLINHLKTTRDSFVSSIKDLSDEEWNTKPDDGGWSPAQCAEHIAIVESVFLAEVKKILDSQEEPEKMKKVVGKDKVVISAMLDRSVKIKGSAIEEVPNKKVDKDQLIKNFLKHRNEIIDWVETTKEPLKVHFTNFPGIGLIDAYQYMLFISAHTERHTMQIKEVLE
jgi:uncharacterized damage-inducible protein DinB